MIDLAVIVVNWNSESDLRACLISLRDYPSSSAEVWVVDNGSADGSVEMVRTEFPDVRLIANSENLGFSKANNLAIAQSQTPFVFLLNSDAAVHAGTLDALISYAHKHPETGISGPKVLNPDETLQYSCRRFPSLAAGFFRNTYLGRLFPRNRYAREYMMGDFDHARERAVDWVSGCAMLIRRDLIDKIGALDDRFFMYCEDVDICKRAWDAGFEVRYFPDAVVTHAIGRSSDKAPEAMIIEFHRSWYMYDVKHHPKAGIPRRIAVASGLWLRAAMRIARRRLWAWSRRHPANAPDAQPKTTKGAQ